ncbi:tyrosine-type recombinase/integrase [Streptococcus thermophilus]|nr:tyrosine-type recombinase/integrase [Streptococcus thermophilus]MCE2173752.1 tyrosine-type recombinase/integrase [Streptococcus thermophilus]MCE2180388.1 tyrosine-type recombinase/integrase [Streptococcus thermophilus]MCE2182046.1 tyrosine-type recombinase/integrase [Streptococcus thermophilus]
MNELQQIQQQRQNNSLDAVRTFDFNTFDRFINYLDASPKTVETYKKALRQFFKYLAINGIRQPQREDVLAFRDDLKASGLKPTTVQNYITATRIFFKWTEQEGLYPNIAEHVKGAKLDKNHKKDYLTSRQAKEVLASIETDTEEGLRNYAILSLMVTGGLRTIEVSRADAGDLRTLGENTVLFVQGKGREEKTEYIKISAPVEKAIRTYLKARGNVEEEQPLFTSTSNNSRGKRISTRTVSAIVKNALKNAGYDSSRLTAHSLRHTAITLALLAGREITEVQQFARHANLNTTMIYNHALDQAKNGCSDAITSAIF